MHIHQTIFKWLMIGLSILLSACGNGKAIIGDDRVWHTFEFNTHEFDGKGKQDVEVLDYLYGDPKGYANRCYSELVARGKCQQGGHSAGVLFPKSIKTLYVKWRVKSTGEIREVTLDMQKKLPKNFGENFRIFISFRGPDLYVYLITPERRADDEPPNGPRATDYLRTLTLYPEPSSERNKP
jgi:hypothetical protein